MKAGSAMAVLLAQLVLAPAVSARQQGELQSVIREINSILESLPKNELGFDRLRVTAEGRVLSERVITNGEPGRVGWAYVEDLFRYKTFRLRSQYYIILDCRDDDECAKYTYTKGRRRGQVEGWFSSLFYTMEYDSRAARRLEPLLERFWELLKP